MREVFLFLVFLFLLAQGAAGQTACNSNNICEYETLALENNRAYAYKPAGSAQTFAIKSTYLRQDQINLDIDNEGGPTLSRGEFFVYSTTGYLSGFVEDIDDISKTATISFGENY